MQLLKSKDISVDLAHDLGDAGCVMPLVGANAAMDIVRCYHERRPGGGYVMVHDLVDHGEGSNWEKADRHDGEHTAAGEPLTESPEPRCRRPLEPVAAHRTTDGEGPHRTCQGSRECGEEADGRPEEERRLEDKDREGNHEEAPQGGPSTHNERRQRPGCDSVSPRGEAGW